MPTGQVTGAASVLPPLACPTISPLGDIPSITLPFGDIKAFGDFSNGMPSKCALNFNLLIQLQPLLVSMGCLLKILNVIGKLEDFIKATKNLDPIGLAKAVPGLLEAIAKLAPCLPPLAFPALIITIKQILQLILNILLCFVEQLESVLNVQLSIDISAAQGNPVLLDALTCARNNAQATMDAVSGGLGALQPMIEMVTMVAGIIGLPISIPNMSGLAVAGDVKATVDALKSTLTTLEEVVSGIPG